LANGSHAVENVGRRRGSVVDWVIVIFFLLTTGWVGAILLRRRFGIPDEVVVRFFWFVDYDQWAKEELALIYQARSTGRFKTSNDAFFAYTVVLIAAFLVVLNAIAQMISISGVELVYFDNGKALLEALMAFTSFRLAWLYLRLHFAMDRQPAPATGKK